MLTIDNPPLNPSIPELVAYLQRLATQLTLLNKGQNDKLNTLSKEQSDRIDTLQLDLEQNLNNSVYKAKKEAIIET